MKIKSFTPLIAVFGTSFLITITLLKSFQIFMGISICLLAMLKLMDIEAFGTSYKKYDLISSQFDSWIYIYPFFELIIPKGVFAYPPIHAQFNFNFSK